MEEKNNATPRRRVAVPEPMFQEPPRPRRLEGHGAADRARHHPRQHRQQMRGVVGIRLPDELRAAGKLLQEIVERLFVISGMQHPLTQNAEMERQVLGSRVRDGNSLAGGDEPRVAHTVVDGFAFHNRAIAENPLGNQAPSAAQRFIARSGRI